MAENIHERLKQFPPRQQKELTKLFDQIRTEIVNHRAAIVGITAQLDLDAGVTDTDYASSNDPAATGLNS